LRPNSLQCSNCHELQIEQLTSDIVEAMLHAICLSTQSGQFKIAHKKAVHSLLFWLEKLDEKEHGIVLLQMKTNFDPPLHNLSSLVCLFWDRAKSWANLVDSVRILHFLPSCPSIFIWCFDQIFFMHVGFWVMSYECQTYTSM
jgi:hypothetical protein